MVYWEDTFVLIILLGYNWLLLPLVFYKAVLPATIF